MRYLYLILCTFSFTTLFGQTELINNGNFSSTSGWVPSNPYWWISSSFTCYSSASGYAYVGNSNGSPANSTYGSIYQEITIPSNTTSATLSFKVSINTYETSTSTVNDILESQIRSTSMALMHTFLKVSNLNGALAPGCQTYKTYSYSIPSNFFGQTIRINFQTASNNINETVFRIDDASVLATVATTSPSISLSGTLAFGNVAANATDQKTMTITNSGNATLNVTSINYPSGFTGDWSGGPISANSSKNVFVTFSPTSATTYSGNVTVNSNAGSKTLAASGTGTSTMTSPSISLSGNLAFGSVAVNATDQKTMTITNSGNVTLNVTSINYPLGFTGDWSGGPISANSSKNVIVTFSPTAATTYSGNVTVNSNAGSKTLAASGTGTSTTTSPSISLSGNLAFGNVAVNSTSQKTMTITNSGNATLNVTSFNYPSGFTGDWSGGPVYANSSKNVIVTFSPTATTTYSANVTVNSNAGSKTLAVSGTGTTGTIIPTVNTITFTNVMEKTYSGIDPKFVIYSGSPAVSNQPIKICADGSASTYIGVTVSNTSGISFKIVDENDNSISAVDRDGKLSSSYPAPVGSNTLEMIYTHPQYMNANGLYRPLKLKVIYNNGLEIANFPLHIYRAPLLMVHGLWGDYQSFEDCEKELIKSELFPGKFKVILTSNISGLSFQNVIDESANFLTQRADYKSSHAKHFDENGGVIPLWRNSLFIKARMAGFSFSKFDLVCHSMGGLLGRLYVSNKYGNYKNDVHKLVTLNTPHRGTQIANYILSPGTYPSLIIKLLHWVKKWRTDEGAIEDFKVKSDANIYLNSNSNAYAFTVPVHTISTEGYSLGDINGDLVKLLLKPVKEDKLFNSESSDLIVPLSSQKAGLSLSATIPSQFHVGSSQNSKVQDRLKILLNADPSDPSYFSQNGIRPGSLTSVFRISSPSPQRISLSDSIYFLSPKDNEIFPPGSIVNVKIRTIGSISKILFAAGNADLNVIAQDSSTSQLNISFKVPDEASGEINLAALGGDGGEYTNIDTLKIKITTTATLDSIFTIPEALTTPVGFSSSLLVKGVFIDGIIRDISRLKDLHIIIDNLKVTHIGNSVFTGKSEGDTSIKITYQGKAVIVPIHIFADTSLYRAYFTSMTKQICSNGEISFSDKSVGSPTSVQWIFPGANLSASTLPNPSVRYNTPGTYDVTLISSFPGKIDTLTIKDYIIVNSNPTPQISGVNSICSGSSTMLDAGNGFSKYLWSSGASTQTIQHPTAGSVSVMVTDQNGCTGSNTFQLIINPIVVPLITQNPTNQTVIFPNGTNFSVAASGSPSKYQWQVRANPSNMWSDISNAGSNPTYTNWTSSTLSVAGTILTNNGYQFRCLISGGSCIDTSIISSPAVLTVNAPCPSQVAPSAAASSNRSATGFTANWSSVSGASGYYLDVSTSPTFIGFVTGYNNLSVSTALSRPVTGLACATTYYYRVRAVNNCGDFSGNSPVVQTITTPCCGTLSGPSLTFGTTSCPGTAGYSTYPPGTALTWNSVPDASGYFVFVSKYPFGTTNLLSYYNPVDCNALKMSPLQSTLVLSAALEPGMLYEWKMSATTDCNSAACAGPLSESRYFYVPPVITQSATEICTGKTITLSTSNITVKSPATLSYQWYLNGIAIPRANSYIYKTSAEGNYYVALTYSGSTICSSTTIMSTPVSVKVKPIGSSGCLSAVANVSDLEEFWIYPNPSTGVFKVKMKFSMVKDVQFTLINNIGQRVYQSPVYKLNGIVTKEIRAGNLSSGIYQLQTTINNEVSTEKVMILR